MALIRYPGSKAKLATEIISRFPVEMQLALWKSVSGWEYREPFFGSGAIGFEVLLELPRSSRIWINDADAWLVNLWLSVRDHRNALCERIQSFQPSVEAFYQFKEQDGTECHSVVDSGFKKLALHQMSVSGFGAMSGGPLGGRDQRNAAYPVHCRWNPSRLAGHTIRLNRTLTRFDSCKITCGDFEPILVDAPRECFIYLDPPYVEKGAQLYKYNMTRADHVRLADLVKSLRCPWVMSYDDTPFIRRLYSWACIDEIFVTYTNAIVKTNRRPKNKEIVITPSSSFLDDARSSDNVYCELRMT